MLRPAFVLAGALCLTSLETAAQSRPALNAEAVRDRLDGYLLAYEPQLSTLVAEELLIQRDGPTREATVHLTPDTKNRRLVSEVAFISLPGGAGWLGFRRAVNLNGKDLPDAGPSLGVLLTDVLRRALPRRNRHGKVFEVSAVPDDRTHHSASRPMKGEDAAAVLNRLSQGRDH